MQIWFINTQKVPELKREQIEQNQNLPACTAPTLFQDAQQGDGAESDHRLLHLCRTTGVTD